MESCFLVLPVMLYLQLPSLPFVMLNSGSDCCLYVSFFRLRLKQWQDNKWHPKMTLSILDTQCRKLRYHRFCVKSWLGIHWKYKIWKSKYLVGQNSPVNLDFIISLFRKLCCLLDMNILRSIFWSANFFQGNCYFGEASLRDTDSIFLGCNYMVITHCW